MTKEEYEELKTILKQGRTLEIKKVKKETLLEFIEETFVQFKEKTKEIQEEKESLILERECIEASKETSEAWKNLLDSVKTENGKLLDSVATLTIELGREKIKKKKLKIYGSIIILILIILVFL